MPLSTNSPPEGEKRLLKRHDRESWVTHKGKRILIHDYCGLRGDEIPRAVDELTDCIVNRGIYELLYLVDVTGLYADRQAIAAFKNGAKRGQPYLKKTAVIGIKGIVEVLLHAVNKFSEVSAVPCKNKREAFDWLVAP